MHQGPRGQAVMWLVSRVAREREGGRSWRGVVARSAKRIHFLPDVSKYADAVRFEFMKVQIIVSATVFLKTEPF